MSECIRVGSRDSLLAVAQSRLVTDYLESCGYETELVTMKTTGDRILDKRLDQIGGKGLFVKELDAALYDGRADLTVHSLKDMPMELPADLPLAAFSKREDPRDVLVLPAGCDRLDLSRPIGSSSLRRVLQLKKLYPEARVESVRGNLQTRLRKLDEGQYSALVLAGAGLHRLGLEERISRIFTPDEMIPAAGQGIIAVQAKAGGLGACASGFDDEEARLCAAAERAYVRRLNGGCSSPIAAYAEISGGRMLLRALYYNEENGSWTTGREEAPVTDEQEAVRLGEQLAASLSGRNV